MCSSLVNILSLYFLHLYWPQPAISEDYYLPVSFLSLHSNLGKICVGDGGQKEKVNHFKWKIRMKRCTRMSFAFVSLSLPELCLCEPSSPRFNSTPLTQDSSTFLHTSMQNSNISISAGDTRFQKSPTVVLFLEVVQRNLIQNCFCCTQPATKRSSKISNRHQNSAGNQGYVGGASFNVQSH